MIELLLPPLLVGLLLALISGPLGAFVVWGRMAYFGDTLAHSALLGVGLSLAFGFHMLVGVALVTALVAIVLTLPSSQRYFANDTLLGIMAHGTLALGLILVSLAGNARVDMMGLLFGDVLAVTWDDVRFIVAGSALVAVTLLFTWRALLSCILSAELSAAEGVPVERLRALLMVLLALTVAVGMRVVGALLITALLIIPPAAARRISSTPEQMALKASLVGVIAVSLGLGFSWYLDTPTGPSIVLAAVLLFMGIHTLAPERAAR
ncbi:ABC-type Mn2+/Zn2+ transport systems, permease component [gamma proteobacterium HdN1]|nr:ABC-type Mn2+/Zn2+ transport systems, permease component [gamma proteobacterium HdN1]